MTLIIIINATEGPLSPLDFPFSLPWRSKQENFGVAIMVARFILITPRTKSWWQVNGPLLGGGSPRLTWPS